MGNLEWLYTIFLAYNPALTFILICYLLYQVCNHIPSQIKEIKDDIKALDQKVDNNIKALDRKIDDNVNRINQRLDKIFELLSKQPSG